MEETKAQRAQREAADAIRFAHTAMELVSLLAVDMLKAGSLAPSTKTKIAEAMRDYEKGMLPSTFSVDRLKGALQGEATLERERKRIRPD